MAETEELGLEVFVEGWQKFDRIMDKLDKSVDGLEKEMKKASKTSGAFSVAIGTIAANAVMALGRALVDVGKKIADFTLDSIGMAADFQDSMAGLSIAASSTGMTFDELKAAALAVGGDTRLLGVTATGAAESLTGLFKAGLTGTEIFGDLNAFMSEGAELGGALRASIDLAAATELDMVQASDLAAIALASFGSEMETEAERAAFINAAMNNMVKAADASVAEVSDLSEALKMVGATAGGMGIPIEDINNALAILSTRGIQGSMAGTSLNRMLLDITKTTPQASKMMEQLGINVFDIEGNMLPLVDIVGQFEKALGGATDAEKAAALQAIFTAQGQRAINTLLTEGALGWDDMAAATEAAMGITEQASIRSETFNAQMEMLDGTVETLKIRIGDALLPVATELTQWFTEMVSTHGPALTEWLGTNIPLAIEAAKVFFMETLLPALTDIWNFTVDNLIPAISNIVTWLATNIPAAIETAKKFWVETLKPALETIWEFIQENIIPILAGLGAVILVVVVPAFIAWAGAAIAAAAATIAALAPVLIPLAAIGVAVALLAKAWETDWGGIRTTLTAVWDEKLKPIFEAIKEWLEINIPVAIETAKKFWEETLKPALETVWEFIEKNIIPIFETVVEWLATNIPIALQALSDLWENTLKPALELVWKFIKENLVPLFEALVELFDVGLTLALTALAGLWENVLEPALKTVWEFIKDNLQPVFDTLKEFLDDKLKTAIEGATPLLDAIKGGLDAIAKAIQPVIDFIKDLTDKLKNIELPDWLTPGSPTPFELGLRGIANALQEVQALSGQVFSGLPGGLTVGAGGVTPSAAPGTQITNNITNEGARNEFNFTAQSLMQPGQMQMEFGTMAMRSR